MCYSKRMARVTPRTWRLLEEERCRQKISPNNGEQLLTLTMYFLWGVAVIIYCYRSCCLRDGWMLGSTVVKLGHLVVSSRHFYRWIRRFGGHEPGSLRGVIWMICSWDCDIVNSMSASVVLAQRGDSAGMAGDVSRNRVDSAPRMLRGVHRAFECMCAVSLLPNSVCSFHEAGGRIALQQNSSSSRSKLPSELVVVPDRRSSSSVTSPAVSCCLA